LKIDFRQQFHCNSSAQDFALAAKSVRMCGEQERIWAIPYLATLDKWEKKFYSKEEHLF